MHTTRQEIEGKLIARLKKIQYTEDEAKSIVKSVLLAEMSNEPSHGLVVYKRLITNSLQDSWGGG